MAEGFIPLSRALLDWDWHDEPKTAWLYVVMLMMANHEETRWRGETLRRGQLLTGRQQLSIASGLTEREVRTAMEHLKKTGDIKVEAKSKYSIVTMIKYEEHCPADDQQIVQQTTSIPSDERPAERPADDQQATNNRPASDQQATTSKNLKNLKKGEARVRFTPPTVEEVEEYCRSRGNGVDAQRFVDFYTMKGWKVGKDAMKDWKAAVRTWESRDENRAPQQKEYDPYAGLPVFGDWDR